MAIKNFSLLLIPLLLAACAGLAPGQLYTHITLPHSRNFHDTPVGTKRITLDERSLREPLTGAGISVEWSEDLIRSEAKKAGITRIAYVERQILSVLFGIYTHQKWIVYGD